MLTAEWGVGYTGGMAGVIGLIYSCLLTRGVEQIAKDTDYPGCTLLGAHGYRTQELVNLLVVGRATSNVFDGDRHLGDPGAADSTLLKGIHRATPVGYLALFEAYGSLEVGARLKHPTSPVWVVCSESHFSVLFVCDEEQIITGESCVPGEDEACELYYYDGLASQEEVIRLSVTPLGGEQEGIPTGGVAHGGKPPLELVIGTRWGRCEVDWNGAERIL